MRASSVFKTLLVVAGVALLLFVAFWVAVVVIGVAIVYFLARAIVRAVTGQPRRETEPQTIVIEPGHRTNYDTGNVIVLDQHAR